MELAAQTQVLFSRDIVFPVYRDHLPEIVPYMPDIASIKVSERKVENGHVSLVNIWTAQTELPALVKKLFNIEKFSWTDHANWDPSAWVCNWRMETEAMPGVVECTGTTSFLESGVNTEIRINGVLLLHLEKAHIPRMLAGVVGPILEKLVVNALKPGLLSASEGVGKYLSSQNGITESAQEIS